MNNADLRETGLMMIQRHGSRAPALALERANEAQVNGDAETAYHWQQVHAAICDLRRTGRHDEAHGNSAG
jgi:hypothetical protein